MHGAGHGAHDGIGNNSGGDITFTAANDVSLKINLISSENSVYGITTGMPTGVTTGNVTIAGKGKITMNLKSTSAVDKMSASGVEVTATYKAPAVPVTDVSLNKSSLTLVTGEYETLIETVNPSHADNNISVKSGKKLKLNIIPNKGYDIEDVKIDGKSIGAVSSYEFKKVKADHTISATIKKIEETKPVIDKGKDFNDVSKNEWYYDAVMKASNKGWFTGTSDTMFSPNSAMSRGMIVTVLWRIEGQPAAMLSSFNDVAKDMYYNSPVAWAAEKGIVKGYGNGVFGPNDSITREQMASILYRYAQYKGYDTTQGGMAIREFSDYENISEYALPTLAWTVNTGLMQGSNNKIMPKDSATRAQVATILMRFSETIVK